MLNLLSKIAVKRADNADAPAVLTNIMDGVDGSSVFGYSREEISLSVDDGQTQDYATDHQLDIRVINQDAQSAVLTGIQAGGHKAIASGYSPDGFLIWEQPSLVQKNTQFDGVLADALLMTTRSVKGYRGTSPTRREAVYAGKNALALYDIAGGSGMGSNGEESPNIFFPFPGVQITASAITDGGSGGMGFRFIESDGTTIISSEIQTVGGDQQPEVSFSTSIIPADTVFIRMVIQGVGYTNPMLGMGTNKVTL